MKVVILTQDDPFYLAENLDYLVSIIPQHSQIIASVVFDVSPFGKRESFLDKAQKTYNIFGLKFFLYYSFKYLLNKLNSNKNVKKILLKHEIPLITIKGNINSKANLEILSALKADLFISIAGNQIFKQSLLDIPPKGTLNLHTALLPKYRGLMPTFWVLKNEEQYTGVSVFFVDTGIDSGEIVVQKIVEIGNMTQEQLIKHTKKIGMECIAEAIDKIENNKVILIPNLESEKSYYSFPTREDVRSFLRKGKRFY